MKKLLLFSALLLSACGQKNGASLADTGRLSVKSEAVTVDTTGVNDTVISSANDSAGIVRASDLLCSLLCFTPAMTLIGTIAPPSVNSLSLQASDVTVNGSNVYVAYNTAGTAQAGGVDVIAIGSGGVPSLMSSTTYADMDINKVYVDAASSKLYLTGNTSSGSSGAILYRIGLDTSGLPTSTSESKVLRSAADATLPAYAGTSVLKVGSYVYAVTGNNGGLSVLNSTDLSDVAFTSIPNARDIALSAANNLLVVTGETASAPAKVATYALATGAAATSTLGVSFATTAIDDAKASIFAGSNGYVVSGGQGGAKFICNGGASIGAMTIPSVSGLTNAEVAANAVTFGNGIVYVAQGGAGVYMYAIGTPLLNLNGCSGYTLSYVGKFNLNGRASANNVYYSNGYLVVATGNGGFQIIQVTQSLITGLLSIL